MHGVSPDSEVIVVDGIAYENEGDGWKQGDPDSEDSDEAIIWAAGQFALAAFSGDIMQQTIAACAVWNLEVGTKRLTLPDSEVVETRVFACAAPFDMYGTTVAPMEVWIGENWTPYGYESTATGYGQVVEGRSLYFDHGIEVDITAPM